MSIIIEKDDKKVKSYGINLIEYFYLFGIDPDSVNVDRFDKEQNYLKRGTVNPELLSKFPPSDKANINVDIKIIKNHCFPNGYTYVSRNSNPVEEYFYFSLDNILGKDSSDKCLNFTCVLFYEPISKFIQVKTIKNPENKKKYHKKEVQFDKIFAPKALCISSFLSFPSEFKFLLSKLISYVKADKITYPIEKIIENMVYGIPRPPRVHFYVHCKKLNGFFPKQDFELDFRLPLLNQCLISSFKLQSIFNFYVDDIIDIYKSLLLEVPVLFFCGKKELLTNIFESFMQLMRPFEFQGPHCAILPDMNAGIIEMSKTFVFGINQEWVVPGNKEKKTYFQKFNLNIINKKILICDIDNHKIYKYYNCNPVQHIVNFKDLGVYSVPEGVDPLMCKSKDINHDCFNNWNEYILPEHYTKKLKKKLKSYMDKNKLMNYIEYNSKTNKEIGEQIFYYYLASIFQSYNDYVYSTQEDVKRICYNFLIKDLSEINIESIFKVKDFTSVNNKDVAFYTKFFETNIFKEFLRRKYLFRDCDKYDILCFDETISGKKNKKLFSKKIKTEFKDCKYLKIKKNYTVKQTKDFDRDEYKYIEEHKGTLIKYYQQYDKTFSYILFPKFIYDNVFFDKSFKTSLYYENELNYNIDDSIKVYQKLKDSNVFSLYNSHFANLFLFDIKTFNAPDETENALYLLWLNIFCLTLHYCEEKEKQYRYEEMMALLALVNLEKRNIINLIISTLEKYGDDKMMIRFFENLNNFSYSNYSYLTSKFFNEKKIVSDLKKMNIANTRLSINYYGDSKVGLNIFDLININSSKNLKPRTFKLETAPIENPQDNQNQLEKEVVVFDDKVECNSCLQKTEIGVITIDFKNMSKDPELKCPECKKLFTPKIHVKLGDTTEKINLYGIYYLYTLSKDIISNYGSKMDMDDLRSKYKDFFWNCIWYFRLKGLSYDMMLKYKFINYYNVAKENNSNKKISFNGLEFQRQNAEI